MEKETLPTDTTKELAENGFDEAIKVVFHGSHTILTTQENSSINWLEFPTDYKVVTASYLFVNTTNGKLDLLAAFIDPQTREIQVTSTSHLGSIDVHFDRIRKEVQDAK